MYAQAPLYQTFYKNITFTEPAYFSMVYYHITFHDLHVVQFTPLMLKHLPYCYYPQKVIKIQDNGVYCNQVCGKSLSIHTHTITIFEKYHELTVLIRTRLQVHFLPLMYTHTHTCTHGVIQFKSYIF